MKKELPMFRLQDGKVRIVKSRFPKRIRDAAHALALSIKKWEFIVHCFNNGEHVRDDGGVSTCALCRLYVFGNCARCPVQKKTGHPFCYHTPYVRNISTPKWARAELAFLKGLQKREP